MKSQMEPEGGFTFEISITLRFAKSSEKVKIMQYHMENYYCTDIWKSLEKVNYEISDGKFSLHWDLKEVQTTVNYEISGGEGGGDKLDWDFCCREFSRFQT